MIHKSDDDLVKYSVCQISPSWPPEAKVGDIMGLYEFFHFVRLVSSSFRWKIRARVGQKDEVLAIGMGHMDFVAMEDSEKTTQMPAGAGRGDGECSLCTLGSMLRPTKPSPSSSESSFSWQPDPSGLVSLSLCYRKQKNSCVHGHYSVFVPFAINGSSWIWNFPQPHTCTNTPSSTTLFQSDWYKCMYFSCHPNGFGSYLATVVALVTKAATIW